VFAPPGLPLNEKPSISFSESDNTDELRYLGHDTNGCVASPLQLSMAIKQHRPRQWAVWGSPARAFVGKARITLARRTLP